MLLIPTDGPVEDPPLGSPERGDLIDRASLIGLPIISCADSFELMRSSPNDCTRNKSLDLRFGGEPKPTIHGRGRTSSDGAPFDLDQTRDDAVMQQDTTARVPHRRHNYETQLRFIIVVMVDAHRQCSTTSQPLAHATAGRIYPAPVLNHFLHLGAWWLGSGDLGYGAVRAAFLYRRSKTTHEFRTKRRAPPERQSRRTWRKRRSTRASAASDTTPTCNEW